MMAIINGAMEKLRPLLSETFDAVAALGGNPAERQNDALSAIAHLAAVASAQLVSRMMIAKSVGPEVAWFVSVSSIQERMQAIMAAAQELHAAGGLQ